MLRAQQAGAVIMPAILSYYHAPKTIDDIVTQYVCRVLAANGSAARRHVPLDRLSRGQRSQSMIRQSQNLSVGF